jgi:hypothetical protein
MKIMKAEKYVTGIIFVLFLAIGMVLYVIVPDRNFSENENRVLAGIPEFSWDNIVSGKFGADVERYLADQMPLRDSMMMTASETRRFMCERLINNVYIAEDGYLIGRFTDKDVNEARAEKNVEELRKFFAASGIDSDNIAVMPVPGADYVLGGLLPQGADVFDTDAAVEWLKSELSDCVFVDLRQSLKESAAQVQTFYRTDHHWTTAGAAAAYMEYAECMGIPVQDTTQMTTLSEDFRGSMYSKVLCIGRVYDTVQIPDNRSVSDVKTDNGADVINGCYDYSYLDRKDKYSIFFGGNFAKINIDTGVENGKHLLVIKDSFANCFVPFLTDDYESITMIDLRYFSGNIKELAEKEHTDSILVIYGLSNMLTDTNFNKLGGGLA